MFCCDQIVKDHECTYFFIILRIVYYKFVVLVVVEDFMRRFIYFVRNIDKNDRVMILHDIDLDGVVSAFIVKKFLEKEGVKDIFLRYHENTEKSFIPEDYEFIKENDINKVISVDLSTDEDVKILRMIEDVADVLIIDHHPVINEVNSDKTVMIKASQISDINPGQYPASKLVYDLFNQVVSLKEYAWIVCLGIKADSAEETWHGFVEKKAKDKEGLYEAEKLLSYACISRGEGGIKDAFNALESSHNYEDIIRSLSKYKVIDKDLEKYVMNFEDYSEYYEDIDLYFVFVESKYMIKSMIANELSKNDVHKTFLVVQKDKGMVQVAARRQDEYIDMGKLMRKVARAIPGATGGGHKAAAGCRFREEYLDRFKNLVVSEIKKIYK